MKNLIVTCLITSSFIYPLAYDSAIAKAQKGNWQDAHSALNNMIIDNPDRADVMYDAGVAAYNMGNRCQAATCFTRAAECSADKSIAFCAHFNAGNVYVDEKKLERALAEYDKALAIEPDNEYARHNRDRVAQMLQQQEQQKNEKQDQNKDDQQEKDEQDQDGQDKQDQQNGNDKQDQSKQQNGNDQQSSNGNDKRDGDQQGDSGQQNQKDNSSNNDSSQDESLNQQSQGEDKQRDAADSSDDAQRKEHGNNKKDKHQNSANNQKRDGKDELEQQSKNAQTQRNEQQSDKHGTTPEQVNVSDDKSNVSGNDGQEQAITDPWLLNILNNQEMHDKAVNKQLMEAKIRQHGGKNGQNCW